MATTGLDMNSQRRVNLLPEVTPGTLNTVAVPVVMTSWQASRKRQEAREKFRPEGSNADAWHALLENSAMLDGALKPDYRQMATLLDMIAGQAVSVDNSVAGQVKRTYLITQAGARNIVTYSGEFGKPVSCERLLYLIAQAFSMKVTRGQTPAIAGNLGLMSLKPDVIGVAMTGGVAQNEIQTLATNPNNGYAGGTVGINAANGGTAQTITPGTDTLAAIQTKIAAAVNKTNGDIVATGTSTAATGSPVANPTAAPTFTVGTNGVWAGPTGTYPVSYSYINAIGETMISPIANVLLTNGSNTSLMPGALPANATNFNAYMDTGSGQKRLGSGTSGSGGWYFSLTAVPAAGAASAPSANTTSTSAALNLNITYSGASVANAPQPLLSSSTTGVTIGRTQGGNAGGGIPNPPQFPMLPQHFSARRASTIAALAAATPLPRVHEINWGHANLAGGFMFFNQGVTTNDIHVDDANPQHTLSLAMAYDNNATCADLVAKSLQEPSLPEAFEIRAQHPTTVDMFQLQGLFSIENAIEQTAMGNVYQYIFPLSVIMNSELAMPDGTPAILRFIVTNPA